MSFSSYFLNIYTEVGLATLFLTGAFAWWKGGAPERLGTLVFGLGTVGADVWRAANGEHAAVMPLFAVDLMMALGFLYIAIRYSSLWLGAAMMLLAASFALHACVALVATNREISFSWCVAGVACTLTLTLGAVG